MPVKIAIDRKRNLLWLRVSPKLRSRQITFNRRLLISYNTQFQDINKLDILLNLLNHFKNLQPEVENRQQGTAFVKVIILYEPSIVI